MEKLITNFQQIGVCAVNVKKVCKAWTNKFSISNHHDKYTLIKQRSKSRSAKVEISKAEKLSELQTIKSVLNEFEGALAFKVS
jgi:hypothetical protein